MSRGKWMRQLVIVCCALISGAATIAGEVADAGGVAKTGSKGPLVKIASPGDGSGFVMAGERVRLLVALELIDVSGAGIVTNDTGMPRFFDANSNVEAFLHHVIAKNTYVNAKGQAVIQLISEIPVDQLVADRDLNITPPIDSRSLTKQQAEEGFEIPPNQLLKLAAFYFRVRDRDGGSSWPEGEDLIKSKISPTLSVGFATSLYRPPDTPKSNEMSGQQKPRF